MTGGLRAQRGIFRNRPKQVTADVVGENQVVIRIENPDAVMQAVPNLGHVDLAHPRAWGRIPGRHGKNPCVHSLTLADRAANHAAIDHRPSGPAIFRDPPDTPAYIPAP